MMTVGERVKKIRKDIGLTLDEFGGKIGVTKTTISRIENNVNNVTEQMCRSICREFGVNETWLRTGDGTMFVDTSGSAELEEIINRRLQSMPALFRQRLTVALSHLSESDWEVFSRFVSDLIADQDQDATDGIPEADHNGDEGELDADAWREAQQYYRERVAEKKAAAKSEDSFTGEGAGESRRKIG